MAHPPSNMRQMVVLLGLVGVGSAAACASGGPTPPGGDGVRGKVGFASSDGGGGDASEGEDDASEEGGSTGEDSAATEEDDGADGSEDDSSEGDTSCSSSLTCSQVSGSTGCCSADGSTAYYCKVGTSTVSVQVCSNADSCGWNSEDSYYGCVANGGGADPSGTYPLVCP
jgi:hypothetical protein